MKRNADRGAAAQTATGQQRTQLRRDRQQPLAADLAERVLAARADQAGQAHVADEL